MAFVDAVEREAEPHIEWATENRAIPSLIANIHPKNTASIHLATKLGFTFDRNDQTPSGIPTLIYRLDV